MRSFDYRRLPSNLMSPQISDRLAHLHECRGKLELIEQIGPEEIGRSCEQTLLSDVLSSAHIEGIYPDRQRARSVIGGSAEPADDPEKELAGYADALRLIDTGYADLPLAPSTLLALHRTMYARTGRPEAGIYRRRDHIFTKVDGKTEMVPVSPITAFETPLCLGAATDAYLSADDARACDALVLIPVFIVDLLCIRPFEMGDGRMSRLVTHLLLLQAGLRIGRYKSIDALIEASASDYYNVLNDSVIGWERNANSYLPFTVYLLDILKAAYEGLFGSLDLTGVKRPGKSERVRLVFENGVESHTKSEIERLCPDISVSTIEAALGALVKEGYLHKVGSGRSTAYVRSRRTDA